MKANPNLKSFVAIAALMGAIGASTGAMGANGGDLSFGDWRYVGGERGWKYEPMFRDGKTRAQVLKELAEFQKNPVSGDWQYVGGEVGWMPKPHSDGAKTRADVLKELEAFNRSPAAQARADELYGNP